MDMVQCPIGTVDPILSALIDKSLLQRYYQGNVLVSCGGILPVLMWLTKFRVQHMVVCVGEMDVI